MEELINEYGGVIIAFLIAGGLIGGAVALFFSDTGMVSAMLSGFEKSICG